MTFTLVGALNDQRAAFKRVVLAAAILFVSACSQRWTLGAINETGVPLVVRVTVGDSQRAWLLPDNGAALLIASSESVAGWVELLDPVSCRILDGAAIPTRSTVVDPEPDAELPTNYSLGLIEDETSRPNPDLPNFQGCPPTGLPSSTR